MAFIIKLAAFVVVLFWALICGTLLAMSATMRKILREIRAMAKTETDLENDLAGIKADLDTISTNVTSIVSSQQTTIDGLKAQIVDLQNQVAAGGAVSGPQLESLVATADAIKAQADGIIAALPVPAPPAAAPVAPAAPATAEPIL